MHVHPRFLCRCAGLPQREAAAALAIGTGAAVGRQLRSIQKRLAGDAALRRRVAALERTLAATAVKY